MNPLGRIKFMFPKRFNVYLHDTPAKHLFSKSSRAFSHGCIRVRRPVALAEYVLRGMPEWTRNKIRDTINSGQTRKVYLPKPVNVHIVYLTSWIDDEGVLQFRNDIYKRDERLYTALLSNPSTLDENDNLILNKALSGKSVFNFNFPQFKQSVVLFLRYPCNILKYDQEIVDNNIKNVY